MHLVPALPLSYMVQLSDLGAMTIELLLQLSLLSHVNYINLVDAGNPFDVAPNSQVLT